jgi:hypothetical protein
MENADTATTTTTTYEVVVRNLPNRGLYTYTWQLVLDRAYCMPYDEAVEFALDCVRIEGRRPEHQYAIIDSEGIIVKKF